MKTPLLGIDTQPTCATVPPLSDRLGVFTNSRLGRLMEIAEMAGSGLAVKAVTTAPELEELRPFWKALNRHPEADLDFILMLAATRPEIVRPHILAVYDGEKPIALLVGRLENARLRPRVGYLTLPRVSMPQIVFVGGGYIGEVSERVTGAFLQEIRRTLGQGPIDRVVLSHVPVVSTLSKSARQCPVWCRSLVHQDMQHWQTTLPDRFETFVAARSKKHRYWLRRIEKAFETQFGSAVRYAMFCAPQDVAPFCEAAESVARRTYQRGLSAGFVDNDENRKRLALMSRYDWFRSYVIFVEEKPVAFWCGEQLGGTFFLTWTGYDAAYGKYEVGTILFLKMVRDLISSGVRVLDYGLGWAPYKERFGDSQSWHRDVLIYAPSPRAVALNLILAAERTVHETGSRLLRLLGIYDRFKKGWRTRLVADVTPPAADAGISEGKGKR